MSRKEINSRHDACAHISNKVYRKRMLSILTKTAYLFCHLLTQILCPGRLTLLPGVTDFFEGVIFERVADFLHQSIHKEDVMCCDRVDC